MSWLCIPDQPPAIAVELLDEVGILCLKHCSDLEHNDENSLETFLINSLKSLHGGTLREQQKERFLLLWLLFFFLVLREEGAGGGQHLGKIEENTMQKENVICFGPIKMSL